MMLFVFVRGCEQSSLYWSSGVTLRTSQTGKETEKEKQIDINYWLEWPAISFGFFFF